MAVRAPQDGTVVFESNGCTYLVTSLSPAAPTEQQIEEYAYGRSAIDQARHQAPNPHIAWFGGHFVEADNPNANGTMWTAKEIAIKSLTPMLMPVTVMHDPRTAVGLIADLALRTPEKDRVQRAKIETALALWKHRFPEVVEEAQHNYEEGTLMQSMECRYAAEECSSCGQVYAVLPDLAQREHWCAHLRGEGSETAGRILRDVTFTGTGLIFGTRGARGADQSAYLESFQEEVAEFHQHASHAQPRRPPKMAMIQIEESERDRIIKERDDEKARADRLETEKAAAEQAAEAAEAAKATAEAEKKSAEERASELEEAQRKEVLAKERLEAFGDAFAEKIASMPTLKKRLDEQAGTLSDEEWSSRLDEVEELTSVKRDAKKEGAPADEESSTGTVFTQEELASSKVGPGSGSAEGQPHAAVRRATVENLIKVV